MIHKSTPPSTASFLQGGGEMGMLMRSHDWSQTPVGSVEFWPQSLKSLVKTLLTSRYPMVLTWGAEFTQFYNDAYAQLIGDKHPAALGTDIRETLAEAWDTLGPMIGRVMATGVANWTPALLLVLERAGYREESYFSVSHAPAEDDTGQIVGMLAVCSEVTQQVLGERRLRLLRDLTAQAVETRNVQETCQDLMKAIAAHPLDVPFALLYLREPDGNTLIQQAAVGLATDTLCPTAIDLTTETDLVTSNPWPLAAAASGETILVEDLNRHLSVPGGPWQELVHTALIMPIASSGQTAPLGVLVAGVNPNRALDEGYRSFYELLISQVSVSIRNAQAHEEERRRAEMLAELDRAKTAFFSNISHEFRTPLTLMLNPLQEVLQRDQLPPTEREQITVAQRNAQRLLKLVNTLLDFSRLEAGHAEAQFESTDLATYTIELASLFQFTVEQAGLRLIVDCPPLPNLVTVDRQMWEQIVLNLLSNAFKFTFEGEITIALHPVGNQVELIVCDTGTGIPPADLPQLFERFHRVAGARGRTFEGTGIGLSLVQELVHLHGGTIAVESTVGQGSTFRVVLPMNALPAVSTEQNNPPFPCDAQPVPNLTSSTSLYVQEVSGWLLADESMDEHPSPQSSTSARIFLVDDNADMRNYLHRILSKIYQVEMFSEGAAALTAARAAAPDLILSDVMMPEMDGFELLKQLRSDPQTREIPTLLLSARAGETAAVEGLSAGADDYLVKPFSTRELLARVSVNVELGRLRQVQRKQAEVALRQSEEQLRSLTATIPQLIWTATPDGSVDYLSHQWADYIGLPPEQLYDWHWQDVVHPEDLPNTLRDWKHSLQMGKPLEIKHRFRFHTGEWRWQLVRGTPIKDTTGKVTKWVGTCTDIQSEIDAQAALHQSEAFNRSIVESSADCIIVLDLNGCLLTLNKPGKHLLGIEDCTSVMGMPWVEFWQDTDRTNASEAILTALAGGTGRFSGYCPTIKGMPKWWDVAVTSILDITGKPKELLVVSRDISDRKQSEALLQATNERLKLLSETTSELLLNENPQSLLDNLFQKLSRHLNLEIYFNYLLEEDGKHLRLNAHGGISAEIAAAAECLELGQAVCGYVVAHQEAVVIEYALESTNPIAVSVQSLGIRAYASHPLIVNHRAIGTLDFGTRNRDRFTPEELELMQTVCNQMATALQRSQLVKALQQRAAELTQANRIKDEFLAMLSHELRTPLNPILGWTRLLRGGSLNAAKTAQAIETIERNAKLQVQLIEDLLDISRILQGKLTLDTYPVQLSFVIHNAIDTVRLAIDAKAIQLNVQIDGSVGQVLGDTARLQQVVWNLLSNAAKFTPQHGQITVELMQVGNCAQIQVKDTGKGIHPDFLLYVFEHFRQEDGSITRKFGGLGLGLAIARQIVELHGGTVWAESEGEGQGATFIVQLPLVSIQAAINNPHSDSSPPGLNLQGVQILVVDDDVDSREFIAFVVEQAGATVITATSATEAITLLMHSPLDVLLSDIGMPDMDGYTLMRKVRSLSPAQNGQVKAIALTAYAGDFDQQQALQAGFEQHISKPVEPDVLVKAIAELISPLR